ncbi:autotransporter assembly complex family protein [Caenimonas sp. SL110]|uniref:autotransporter assembly complex protein TamA n=1 Tax=Caenimonas sp. SL110 TaxID=1450524 RepID=UPI00069E5AAA|nr:BamA/TamA family outer membrane protein [Caenimonas sp. SL110]
MRLQLHWAQSCVVALGLSLSLVGAAHSQASSEAARPAFAIDVRAPAPIKSLLDRHLELRRYREVTDLDDTELARLIVMAERDVRELVGTLGYFDPKIVVRRDEATRASPLIVIEVEPGKLTQVSEVKIEFEGDVAQSADAEVTRQRDEIRAGWRLPIGQRFTQESWDQAKSTALRQLMARRYPVSRISYSLADIDAPNSRAGLGLKLDSGPPYRLGEMVVTGVERYDPVLVPRLARLPVGSIYDQEALVQAQLRLAGSGYFDSAFILLDTEGDPKAAPVQVTVREAPLHKLVLGLGVSTDSGARGSVEYRNNRVPVIGWRAVTKLQLERKSPFVETEWTAVPDADGWRWGVLARAERVDDGVLVTHGQKLRVGRTWVGDHIERNVYAQYERANVRAAAGAATAIPDNGDGTAISANYVWTGRYFDRMPYPTRGYGVGFELGGGLTLTGSRSPFQRTLVRWLGVRPLQSGRLQLRAEAGAVIAKSTANVPASQLFRTGGDTTVRGYGYREIGVERPGNVVGPGRYMAVGSVEWQQPIKRGGLATEWESAVFIDGGAVSDRIGGMKPVFGVGAGARWKSPLGPLQVDLAYGIQPKKFRLHFNLGVTF